MVLNPTWKHPWASVLGHPRLQTSTLKFPLLLLCPGSECVGGGGEERPVPSSYSERLSPGPGGWHNKHPPNLGCLEGMGEGSQPS